MRNKDRKQMQRKVNKAIRTINRNIEEDELWKGRFHMRQKNAAYYPPDQTLLLLVEMADKKTGRTAEKYLYYTKWGANFFNYDLFLAMNEFITEDCHAHIKEDSADDR